MFRRRFLAGLGKGTTGHFAMRGSRPWTEESQVAHARIPDFSDWVDRGTVLTTADMVHGSNLDDCLSPSQIIYSDGIYYMYYAVASGTRSEDDGPAYRAVCVATTTDITDPKSWTVYPRNPIIKWQPTIDDEEGVLNATGFEKDGSFYLYYTAMSYFNHEIENSTTSPDSHPHLVEINVRLATSFDGLRFTDRGRVLSVHDSTLWSSPDPRANELFSIGAMEQRGTWYLYYLAKTPTTSWDLGVAWGDSPTEVSTNSAPFLQLDEPVHSNCVPVQRGMRDDDILFLPTYGGIDAPASEIFTDARLAPSSDPASLGEPETTYNFGDVRHTTLWRDRKWWYLFYQTADKNEFGMRVASL